MKRSFPLAGIAALTVAALTLAACGSSGSDVSAPVTTTAASNAATTAGGSDTSSTGDSTSAESSESSSAEAADQDITFVLSDEPDGLDPSITNNSFASPYLTNLFEGLVTYDKNGELVPGLAESWDVSPDGTEYTFHLRDGLKWSDGTPLTAKDFEYTFFRLLDPKTTAQYVTMLTDYVVGAEDFYNGKAQKSDVGIKAVDDNTFQLTLKAPAAQFIDILSIWAFDPVQQATVEANGDKWTLSADTFVSDGPFKVSEIKPGESLTMVKNDNYWDAANVKLHSVTLRMIKDTSTGLNAFTSGEVDGIRNVPSADFPKLKAEDDRLHINSSYAVSFFVFNTKKAPFDNPKVREAISMAIDRQSIINNVLKSSDAPAFSPIPGGYVVNGKDYADGRGTYNLKPEAQPEAAQKLLAEAGYPDGKGFPELQIYYYTDPVVKLVTEAIAQMLRDNLNIKVTTPTEEWKVLYSDIQAGKFEMAATGWGADYFHPMTFFPLYKTGDPSNMTGWSNPDYDSLLTKAMTELDPEKQVQLLRQADDIVSSQHVVMPTYYRSTSFMMSDKVQGWYMTPMSALYFKNAYVTQ